MPHTFTSLLVHCVFSTKERRKSIPREFQLRLWAYLGGIARSNNIKPLTIGGTEDHVHLLLSIPASMSVAKAVQLIKSGSSKWVHENTTYKGFAWQEAYGAFTIGISQVPHTTAYIKRQPEHHAKRRYEDEFLAFLKKHGIQFDEKYLFD